MPRTRATTVEVNGYAGRHIRNMLGIDADEVATKMGVTRDYIYKIELGYNRRLSLTKFRLWQNVLLVQDRRALMCNPHDVAADDNGGEDAA